MDHHIFDLVAYRDDVVAHLEGDHAIPAEVWNSGGGCMGVKIELANKGYLFGPLETERYDGPSWTHFDLVNEDTDSFLVEVQARPWFNPDQVEHYWTGGGGPPLPSPRPQPAPVDPPERMAAEIAKLVTLLGGGATPDPYQAQLDAAKARADQYGDTHASLLVERMPQVPVTCKAGHPLIFSTGDVGVHLTIEPDPAKTQRIKRAVLVIDVDPQYHVSDCEHDGDRCEAGGVALDGAVAEGLRIIGIGNYDLPAIGGDVFIALAEG